LADPNIAAGGQLNQVKEGMMVWILNGLNVHWHASHGGPRAAVLTLWE